MKKHNDQKFNEVLQEMVNRYRLKSKLHQTKINSLWGELMGPTISTYTRNISVRKKTLYITIDSASLKNELSLAKKKIIKIINEELGENYIEEVVIR